MKISNASLLGMCVCVCVCDVYTHTYVYLFFVTANDFISAHKQKAAYIFSRIGIQLTMYKL